MCLEVELSIVIPVYGCEDSLENLHRRLESVLKRYGVTYEIIFVDDRGPDRAWELIKKLAGQKPQVRGVRLERNYGQAAAIAAGVSRTSGEWVSVMDCDLQDSPEAITRLLDERDGADVILFRLGERAQSRWRVLVSRVYFMLLRLVIGNPSSGHVRNFSLTHRRIIDRYMDHPGLGALYVSLVTSLTDNIKIAGTYHKQHRPFGESSYNLKKLLGSAVVNLSAYPRRVSYSVLFPGIVVCALVAMIAVYRGTLIVALPAITGGVAFLGVAIMIYVVYRKRVRCPFKIEKEIGFARAKA